MKRSIHSITHNFNSLKPIFLRVSINHAEPIPSPPLLSTPTTTGTETQTAEEEETKLKPKPDLPRQANPRPTTTTPIGGKPSKVH